MTPDQITGEMAIDGDSVGPRDSGPVLDPPFGSVADLEAVDPTERMSRAELDALRASSRPPPAEGITTAIERMLEDFARADLDDIPDDPPTTPSCPEAKRRSTPFPR